MTVLESINDYIDTKGIVFSSADEVHKVRAGIEQYLRENGIKADEERDYFKKYVNNHLKIIEVQDLKEYFIHYNILSNINQIVIEKRNGKLLNSNRKNDLLLYITQLQECGLGEKYIPILEVKEILGENV